MFKLAIIGLDTSHSIVFTDLIQGKQKMVEKLHVASCMRFPSAFQSEVDQDKRQEQIEQMGVMVTRSFEDAVENVDGIMLEINDPALHLEYFAKAAELELPVFLDKPMADNLENGRRIYEIVKNKNIKTWSSSSLRFTPEIIECATKIKSPKFCNVFGALGQAPRGNSLVWYGIHTFEMLMTLMGRGAESVYAREDTNGIVSIVNYRNKRRGIVECNNEIYNYGGQIQNDEVVANFVSASSPYPSLIRALEKFYTEATIPVAFEDTLEIQAMLEAASKSIESGKEEIVSQEEK